ncbi:MAG TPA: M20/M25/M40 family metallo-hydrolase [Acidimicrobiia bacterium]|nr:M20/M25/M40 family metallo-hydrolase [Acidimicrobiia bacterium]
MTIPAGEVADLLVQLIGNRCVNDGTPGSGGEVRSADTLDAYLGVTGERIVPAPGRVSVVYRLPGDPDLPAMMLMGHTDVVPAGEGWTVDPFAAERRDGFVWGRGAIDMLDQTAAMAAVFRRALSGGVRYPGDLVFLAAADEEAGGRLGARHLVEEHWDVVQTDLLLTEIATPALEGAHGPGVPVTVAEKGPQWRRLRSGGTAGHGSQPYGADNALVPLAAAMWRLGTVPSTPVMTDEWHRFVAAWDPPDGLAAELLDPKRVDEAIARIAATDPGMARWVHACTHLTVSPNLMQAGVKANVIPDRGVAEIDVRVLPGQDPAAVRQHFEETVGGLGGLEYEEVESTTAGGSPPEGPLWEAITAALATHAPGHHPIPTMIPVGTDARFFRPKGVVAYGVGLMDSRIGFGDFLRMFHGPDERVSEASLGLTADLYVEILQRLGAAFGEL